MRWARAYRLTSDIARGWQRRVVPISRRWDQVAQVSRHARRRRLSSPVLRGERAISRTPLRREGRVAPVEPVVFLLRSTTGATSIRSSLRPPPGGGTNVDAKPGRNPPRDAESRSHCCHAPVQARHPAFQRPLGSSTAASGILDRPAPSPPTAFVRRRTLASRGFDAAADSKGRAEALAKAASGR
jgi:hypothetical protein